MASIGRGSLNHLTSFGADFVGFSVIFSDFRGFFSHFCHYSPFRKPTYPQNGQKFQINISSNYISAFMAIGGPLN